MILYLGGDLLEDDADVLVNTINCVGAMGAGIALQFKNKFPLNFLRYQQNCRIGKIKPASLFKYKESGQMIYNLATKDHWKDATRLSWIVKGCENIRKEIQENNLNSIAIPALGCNNGGASWPKVKNILESRLSGLDCEVRIYLPKEGNNEHTTRRA